MKRQTMKRLATGVTLFGLVLAGTVAVLATNMIVSPTTCTTARNCNSRTIEGSVSGASGNLALPWTGEVFASAGECLRLDVLHQPPTPFTGDLEMVVVAPNGAVYRNDDQMPVENPLCPLCPLVKVNPT